MGLPDLPVKILGGLSVLLNGILLFIAFMMVSFAAGDLNTPPGMEDRADLIGNWEWAMPILWLSGAVMTLVELFTKGRKMRLAIHGLAPITGALIVLGIVCALLRFTVYG